MSTLTPLSVRAMSMVSPQPVRQVHTLSFVCSLVLIFLIDQQRSTISPGEGQVERLLWLSRSNPVSWGWDLVEWSERCASTSKIAGSNPSGGSELTFRSDLLLTVRG
jgi:hypothetical protein